MELSDSINSTPHHSLCNFVESIVDEAVWDSVSQITYLTAWDYNFDSVRDSLVDVEFCLIVNNIINSYDT
jgi:hypothetical protein